jgi:hypothetical protein
MTTHKTVPRHIWYHEVEMAAIRGGAKGDWIRERFPHSRMSIWYNAGEAIGGAVDMILFCWKQEPIGVRDAR